MVNQHLSYGISEKSEFHPKNTHFSTHSTLNDVTIRNARAQRPAASQRKETARGVTIGSAARSNHHFNNKLFLHPDINP